MGDKICRAVFKNGRSNSKAEENRVRNQGREMADSKSCELSTANDGKVAPFIAKLYKMLTSPAFDSICSFDASRTTLQIFDTSAFEEEVLPQVLREHMVCASFSKCDQTQMRILYDMRIGER